jgi:hypothetical protein
MPSYYYSHAGQRFGPVPPEEIRGRLARSEITPADLAWTDGMPDWQPISAIPELSSADPIPLAAAALAGTVPITGSIPMTGTVPLTGTVPEYFRPRGDVPPWAAVTLKGHARPTGDTSTWPLDETGARIFSETLKHRKQITSATNLFKGLGALCAIAAVVFLFVFLFGAASGKGGPGTILVGTLLGVASGFTVLYFFAAHATHRSRPWASLTLGILYVASIGLDLVSLLTATANPNPLQAIFGVLITVFITAIFAIVAFRAWLAIPRFLAQPAWAQELLIRAKL